MSRGELTEQVKQLMIQCGLDGIKDELRLLPYMMSQLLDNRCPSNINRIERRLLSKWKSFGWITELDSYNNVFIISESFLDRIYKILKLAYCNNVIEKDNYHSYILFEGPDGSGKSSIISYLQKDLDLKGYCILDRDVISDEVYSDKFNREAYRGTNIDIYLTYHKQRVAHLPHIKIIHCTASTYTLQKRCIEKTDDLTIEKDLGQIYDELDNDKRLFNYYLKLYCRSYKIPYITIDTTKDTLEQSVNKAKLFILGEETKHDSV